MLPLSLTGVLQQEPTRHTKTHQPIPGCRDEALLIFMLRELLVFCKRSTG